MTRQEDLLTGGWRGVGDGRADGSSAIGDTGPAATSLTPDMIGQAKAGVCIFKSSQLEGSYVGHFLYLGRARVKIRICQPTECTPT